MHGEYAFVGHGEVALALLRALFLLLFAILMRIDLFDVFKDYFSHVLLLLLYIAGRSGKITGACRAVRTDGEFECPVGRNGLTVHGGTVGKVKFGAAVLQQAHGVGVSTVVAAVA